VIVIEFMANARLGFEVVREANFANHRAAPGPVDASAKFFRNAFELGAPFFSGDGDVEDAPGIITWPGVFSEALADDGRPRAREPGEGGTLRGGAPQGGCKYFADVFHGKWDFSTGEIEALGATFNWKDPIPLRL
jgi:hypothetical protein